MMKTRMGTKKLLQKAHRWRIFRRNRGRSVLGNLLLESAAEGKSSQGKVLEQEKRITLALRKIGGFEPQQCQVPSAAPEFRRYRVRYQ